jgi:hypothetical protein
MTLAGWYIGDDVSIKNDTPGQADRIGQVCDWYDDTIVVCIQVAGVDYEYVDCTEDQLTRVDPTDWRPSFM